MNYATIDYVLNNGMKSKLYLVYTDTHFRIILDNVWYPILSIMELDALSALASLLESIWEDNPEFHMNYVESAKLVLNF
jgi:hypothetical protein